MSGKESRQSKAALNDLYSEALCDFTKLFKEKRKAIASKKKKTQKKAKPEE